MEYSIKNFVISENLKDSAKTFYSSNCIGRDLLTSYDLVMDHFKNCHNHTPLHSSRTVVNDVNHTPVIYENQEESDIYFNFNTNTNTISNQFSGMYTKKKKYKYFNLHYL